MDSRLVLGVLLLGACTGAHLGGTTGGEHAIDAPGSNGGSDSGSGSGSGSDSGVTFGPWQTPTAVPGASTAGASEDDVTLNGAMTELYFAIPDTTITGNPKDLYWMTRATPNDAWGTPVKLTVLDTSVQEESPRLSPDELTLYFGRNGDIFKSTRTSATSPWGSPVAVAAVNSLTSTDYEKWMAVCNNNHFVLVRNNDFYEGVIGQGLGTAVAELNSTSSELSTYLSKDCLTIYFASNRAGSTDLYMATRTAVTDNWNAPVPVSDLNTTTYGEEDPWLSPDGHTLYFASNATGTKDVLVSKRN